MKIYCKDVDKLTNEEYAKIRKDTFGASDVATIFGLGFQTLEEVIAVKANPIVTQEELDIGDLPNVRKGRDLEPLILSKYEKKSGNKVEKPTNMYEIWPGLTINFDGTVNLNFPVEAKYVTTFGHKNYKTDLDYYILDVPKTQKGDIVEHIRTMADILGIPPYYYTQLQTQIEGLKASHGELAALFEKDWTLRVYRVSADPHFAKALKIAHFKAYEELKEAKGIVSAIKEKDYEY